MNPAILWHIDNKILWAAFLIEGDAELSIPLTPLLGVPERFGLDDKNGDPLVPFPKIRATTTITQWETGKWQYIKRMQESEIG